MFNYNQWYVVATQKSVKKKPIAITVLKTPLVLFKVDEEFVVLEDRCPHKNAPLSLGHIKNNRLVCGYHGWSFKKDGELENIPSQNSVFRCGVKSYKTQVYNGLIWVFMNPEMEPSKNLALTKFSASFKQMTFFNKMKSNADLILENALDCTHTAFLHDGLFRASSSLEKSSSTIIQDKNSLSVRTHEVNPSNSLAMKFLGKGDVNHVDTYLPPNTMNITYEKGFLTNTTQLHATPIDERNSLVFTTVHIKAPVFISSVICWFLRPIILVVIRQDKKILEAQTKCIATFGKRHFRSVKADLASNTFFSMYQKVHEGEEIIKKAQRTIEYNL